MPDDNLTREYIDSRFDRLGRQIAEVDAKTDRNHNDTKEQFDRLNVRVSSLEAQYPGHSDEQIIEMIDERLQTVMPGIVEAAVGHALERPLKRVDESIEASKQNRNAIRQVQDDLRPLVEIHDGIVFLKRAVVTLGGIGSAALVVWAVVSGLVS